MNPNFLPSGHLLHQRYSIQQSLGQGGFGITYLAYDTILAQEVCIKELFIAGNSTRSTNLTVLSQSIQGFSFEDFVNRFMEEARKLAQFRHPNIVRVLEWFQANATAYMVMDYVKGETLKQKVQKQGALSEHVAMKLIDQLLNGVEEVHKKGMLHRDIKPDNILLTPEGQLVLIDFGSAREFSIGMTTTHTAMVSDGYAPIEQYSSRAQRGPYTDIYALGATLYFMLTAEKPFAATDRSFEELAAPHRLNTVISSQVSSAVMLAMEMKPSHRFQNIAEMREWLKSLQGAGTGKEKEAEEYGTLSEIEWNEYKTIRIGDQVWMSENLDVDRFRNGDRIPEAKTAEEWKRAGKNKQPAWSYYNNDPANSVRYGKLYNWYAVTDPRGLAPGGWHTPGDGEWTALTNYLGGQNSAGGKMKTTSGWNYKGNGTNESGFSGLPGGLRYGHGEFYDIGFYGYWWSSTENRKSPAWTRYLSYTNGNGVRNYGKGLGFSVRCLRD